MPGLTFWLSHSPRPVSTLWRLRWLLGRFLAREIKTRYLGSISGIFWVFIQPVAQLAIYSFVFAVIFKVRFPELGEHGFVVFVAVALWPWLAFAEALQRASVAVQNNASLVKKVNFPHELVVLAAVGASYVVHGAGYLLILMVLWGLGAASLDFLALPAVLLLLVVQLFFTLGLGLLFAAFQVFLRDLEHILASVLMLWFYVTPILYPRSLVPDSLQPLMDANPMSYFIDRIRWLLMQQGWEISWLDLFAIVASVTLCYFAWRLFRRCATRFEDFV